MTVVANGVSTSPPVAPPPSLASVPAPRRRWTVRRIAASARSSPVRPAMIRPGAVARTSASRAAAPRRQVLRQEDDDAADVRRQVRPPAQPAQGLPAQVGHVVTAGGQPVVDGPM